MENAPSPASGPPPRASAELIVAGRAGDRQALRVLIETYQARIAAFVLSQTADPNAVEDICQTAFVKMVVSLPRLRDPSRFESWLFQIARNACRDHLRAALGWRRYFVPYDPAYERIPGVPSGSREHQLENGLAQLAPADRDLLRLQHEEKKSCEELARLSDTTPSAIKSRLYRARRQLRGLLLAGDSE